MTTITLKNRAAPPEDPQQEAVYEWERSFVETRVPAMVLSSDDIYDLTMKASIILNIPQPRLTFVAHSNVCVAKIHEHSIRIADWGRNSATVLHEVAHLATWRSMLHGDSAHGSAFLTAAMALYHMFMDIPLDYLVETARSRHLKFNLEALKAMTDAAASDDFYPEDF